MTSINYARDKRKLYSIAYICINDNMTHLAHFWGLYRWTATHWCPWDNFLANLIVPGGFSTRWVRSWRLFRYTATPWGNIVANHSLQREFECIGGFFESLSTFLRITIRKPHSQKTLPWFCSTGHHEFRGTAVGYLLASGYTSCALAAVSLWAVSERTIGFSLPFPEVPGTGQWRERFLRTWFSWESFFPCSRYIQICK